MVFPPWSLTIADSPNIFAVSDLSIVDGSSRFNQNSKDELLVCFAAEKKSIDGTENKVLSVEYEFVLHASLLLMLVVPE